MKQNSNEIKQAIILAGGAGTRLKPFTACIPKPLVPIDDIPILEVVLRQLKYYGFTDIVIAVNHLAELIMAFFQDGKKLGLRITYSVEDAKLGTAGPLALVDDLRENFIVMNGDLLTTINMSDFFNFHLANQHDVTIATHFKEIKIDLGVLEINNGVFENYIEKPSYRFTVSTGIYAMNRDVVKHLENDEIIDMPSFILRLKSLKKKIKCYSKEYYWLDIGRVDDYDCAIKIFQEKKDLFLPK